MDSSLVSVTAVDMGSSGEGIARLENGKTVFVQGLLTGETAEVRITGENSRIAYGEIVNITEKSSHRVEADPEAVASGCNMAHADYDFQLEYKRGKVVSCLKRIGKISDAESLVSETVPSVRQTSYRNHMQYVIRDGKTGFQKAGTNEFVTSEENMLEYEVFRVIRKKIERIFESWPTVLFDGLVLRGSERTKQLLAEFVTDDSRPHEIVLRDCRDYIERSGMASEIEAAAEGYKLMGIVLRISPDRVSRRVRSGFRTAVYGMPYYDEILLGKTFRIKSGAFFQVNTETAEKLYSLASEAVSASETVYDFYCGTGSIGLSVTRADQHLIGVESNHEAVESAKENASLMGYSNARFICKEAEKLNFQKEKLPSADAVIVDPPRKGMDIAFVRKLMELAPLEIVYISCDPATLARDIQMLSGKYEIRSVTPVDMFANTCHVETVCLLINQNVKSQHYVNVGIDTEDHYRMKENNEHQER